MLGLGKRLPLSRKLAGEFSPSDIANLGYWFDLTDVTTLTDDGAGLISKAVDKVAGLEATAATTARPTFTADQINGLGVLRYNGSSNTLAHTSQDLGTAFTLFVVEKSDNLSDILIANGTSDYRGIIDVKHYTYQSTSKSAKLFKRYYNGWSYNCMKKGADLTWYDRKTLRPTDVDSIDSSVKLVMTNIGRSGSFWYESDVAEIIAYSRELTDAEILQVDNYLEAKYALVSEPANDDSRIAFYGSSMTSSELGGLNGNSDYPPLLISDIIAVKGACEYFEFAVGGSPTQTLIDYDGFAEDLIAKVPKAKNDFMIVWEITNDLVANEDSAGAITRISALCQTFKTAGFTVGIVTCLPRSNAGLYANFETDRIAVNASIRTNFATYADYLIDVGGDALMGQAGDSDDTTYYNADKTHPNSTGYERLVDNYFYPDTITEWTD